MNSSIETAFQTPGRFFGPLVAAWGLCWICPTAADADPFDAPQAFLPYVARAVPDILKSQDPRTGRFGGDEGWVVRRQNVLLTLAAAWATEDQENPYHHDAEVLDAILAGGDALIAEQDAAGRLPFRRGDGSLVGRVYLPWTYSRWVRAFAAVQDAMPRERRERWKRALTLAFTGIAAELRGAVVQNIPAHHAMALYVAGKALERPEWREQAAAFLARVAEAQKPGGFWSEHQGPVVNYNFVYVDALGTYYALSRDARVLDALARASRFHANFTYPDGSYVETIDERNPYDLNYFKMPNVGFTFSPEGRGFVRQQLRRKVEGGQPIDADLAASFVLYGGRGEAVAAAGERAEADFILGDNDAMIRRRGPWFLCLSAYHSPVVPSRWIQDRQNFVSLFHDKTGLILGGGNTKLQPLWSTFTVGDVSLLAREPGDANPNFLPPAGLIHVPSRAALRPKVPALDLAYGDARCRVTVALQKSVAGRPDRAKLIYALDHPVERPVAAHLTLMPQMGGRWETASGKRGAIGEERIALAPGEAGAWFAHRGWRVSLPAGASVVWPVLPHQPYARDGRAGIGEGRIVVVLPFDQHVLRHEIVFEVGSRQ